MHSRHIEVIDRIAQVVAVRGDGSSRADGELERQAALVHLAAGMHPDFHQTFAHWPGVLEFGDVTDGIKHLGL